MENRLKKVMMESETSIEELAQTFGYTCSFLETQLGDETDLLDQLTGKEVKQLARYFHTNPAYLVGWSDDDKPMNEKKYTIQVLGSYDGFLNKACGGSGGYFFDDNHEENTTQTHFTQSEIDELKQRDDLCVLQKG